MGLYTGKQAEEIYQYDGSTLLPRTILEGIYTSEDSDKSGSSLIRSLFSGTYPINYNNTSGNISLNYNADDFELDGSILCVKWEGHSEVSDAAKKLVDNSGTPIETSDSNARFSLQYFTDGVPKAGYSILDTLYTSSKYSSNAILYVNESTSVSGQTNRYKTTIAQMTTPTASDTYLKYNGSGYEWSAVESGGKVTMKRIPSASLATTKYYIVGTNNTTDNIQASELYFGTSDGTSGTYFCSNNLYQTSDESLKTFIDTIDVDLDNLKTIKKGEFYWNDDPDKKTDLGVTAQSLEALYPQIVSEDNGIKSVAYNKLGVIALAAIDKLYDRIQELEKEVEELKRSK